MDELANTKGNILLVDDIPENLQILSDLLIEMGYTTRSVTGGRMALKTIKIKRPDLILLDIKMPEMSGYEVCEAIKANDDLQDIPVIFISALDEALDKVRAFNCGGVDYITKPFQIEEVVARIDSQLTIQRQRQSLQQEVRKRQETEEILYQSRAVLASILNTSLDGIAALQSVRDPGTGIIEDFRCLVINPVMAKAFNSSREAVIGKLILKKFLCRFAPELFERLVKVVETGTPLEEDIYYPMGESSWYHLVVVKLGDGFAITVRDITLRKKMELELQEANNRLKLLANVDGLTQVANRRCFDDSLAQEWRRHQREKQPLSLILIDIDYFKSFNDCYGHQNGDNCLIQVAQAIAQVPRRSTDLVARYGGEEFAVILPNTDAEGALLVAESIRKQVTSLAIPHEVSQVSQWITLSAGVASLTPDGSNKLDNLIANADQALYTAKDSGRDRAVVFN